MPLLHCSSQIGWSRQPATDETRVAFENRKIIFEIDLAEISFDHLRGKRETSCLDLLPAQQFACGAVALRAAILLEMVGPHAGILGSPRGTAQPGRWETGGEVIFSGPLNLAGRPGAWGWAPANWETVLGHGGVRGRPEPVQAGTKADSHPFETCARQPGQPRDPARAAAAGHGARAAAVPV